MKKKHFCLFLFCISTILCSVKAQSVDSLHTDSSNTTILKKKKKKPYLKNHSPKLATLMSTALPGLGQVYNRKYWKPVIIYGLGSWLTYNVISNNREYTAFRDALFERQERAACEDCTDEDKAAVDEFVGVFSDSQLRTRKNFHKKKRDDNIIYLLLLYGANIIDAAVDAHLINFNVGEEYIMSLEPTFIQTASVSNSIGLSLTLNFR